MSNITETCFAITKEQYVKRVANNDMQSQWDGISFEEVVPPRYAVFLSNLKKVGEEWGWDLMKNRFNEAVMKPKLSDPKTKLRVFLEDDNDNDNGLKRVGYVLAVPADQKLKAHFWGGSDPKVMELVTIGLYPEACGQGKGWPYFEMQFKDLFENHGYDVVYWSSSSSNHPNLVDFYKRMGIEVLETREVPDHRISKIKHKSFDVLVANNNTAPRHDSNASKRRVAL